MGLLEFIHIDIPGLADAAGGQVAVLAPVADGARVRPAGFVEVPLGEFIDPNEFHSNCGQASGTSGSNTSASEAQKTLRRRPPWALAKVSYSRSHCKG